MNAFARDLPGGVRIAGTGQYLPGPPIDQAGVRALQRRAPDPLPARVQDRLLEESGILTRYFGVDADGVPCETNTSMAAEAGRRALAAAGWQPTDVQLLVVTTVVPDHLMPPTSTLVQEALGIPACAELELCGNCTAPYKALLVAADYLRLRECTRALVCSSNYVSFLGLPPWGDPTRMTASQAQLRWLLSDGAGAIALESAEPDTGLRVWLESSGCGRLPGMELAIGAATPDITTAFQRGQQHTTQNTRRLREDGIRDGANALERMLQQFEIAPGSIDHFIPEIPSIGFADIARPLLADRLGLPEASWRIGLDEIGNIGGATLPVMLDRLARSGHFRSGDLVVSFAEESSKWMFSGAVFRWNP